MSWSNETAAQAGWFGRNPSTACRNILDDWLLWLTLIYLGNAVCKFNLRFLASLKRFKQEQASSFLNQRTILVFKVLGLKAILFCYPQNTYPENGKHRYRKFIYQCHHSLKYISLETFARQVFYLPLCHISRLEQSLFDILFENIFHLDISWRFRVVVYKR